MLIWSHTPLLQVRGPLKHLLTFLGLLMLLNGLAHLMDSQKNCPCWYLKLREMVILHIFRGGSCCMMQNLLIHWDMTRMGKIHLVFVKSLASWSVFKAKLAAWCFSFRRSQKGSILQKKKAVGWQCMCKTMHVSTLDRAPTQNCADKMKETNEYFKVMTRRFEPPTSLEQILARACWIACSQRRLHYDLLTPVQWALESFSKDSQEAPAQSKDKVGERNPSHFNWRSIPISSPNAWYEVAVPNFHQQNSYRVSQFVGKRRCSCLKMPQIFARKLLHYDNETTVAYTANLKGV